MNAQACIRGGKGRTGTAFWDRLAKLGVLAMAVMLFAGTARAQPRPPGPPPGPPAMAGPGGNAPRPPANPGGPRGGGPPPFAGRPNGFRPGPGGDAVPIRDANVAGGSTTYGYYYGGYYYPYSSGYGSTTYVSDGSGGSGTTQSETAAGNSNSGSGSSVSNSNNDNGNVNNYTGSSAGGGNSAGGDNNSIGTGDVGQPTTQPSAAAEMAMPGMAVGCAYLTVHVPADAQVWIGGQLKSQTGTVRQFYSPPLLPGVDYTYQIGVRWVRDGKPVERVRQVPVRAGASVTADFTRPPLSSQPPGEDQ